MSERFFRSNRPGYSHPVSSELENSGIRVAVGDCSVTERRRWRPPYQTGKTVHVHAKHYIHDEDGRTAPGVCGNGSVPLSHSGNVVTRIGIHTHINNPFSKDQLKTGQSHQINNIRRLKFRKFTLIIEIQIILISVSMAKHTSNRTSCESNLNKF